MKEQYALHMVRSMPDHSVCICHIISDMKEFKRHVPSLAFRLLIAEKLGRESAEKVSSYHTVDSRIRVDEGRWYSTMELGGDYNLQLLSPHHSLHVDVSCYYIPRHRFSACVSLVTGVWTGLAAWPGV